MIVRNSIISILMLLLINLIGLHCSIDSLSGGGTEDGNPTTVSGRILNRDGTDAANVEVYLLPQTFNPVIDSIIPDSLTDTTDKTGKYVFTIQDSGLYNIEAVHTTMRHRLLIQEISLAGDTVIVPAGRLDHPGSINLFLPDSVDKGYLFVQGTTIFKNLSWKMWGKRNVSTVIDSVPAGSLPGIYYTKDNNIVPVNICDTLQVTANDTASVEAFVYWALYTTKNTLLSSDTINDVIITPQDVVWLCTYNGVIKGENGSWKIFNSQNSGLFCDTAYDVTYDNTNKVWVSTPRGAAFFNGTEWDSLTASNSGLPPYEVTKVLQDSDGTYWIITRGGGVVRKDGDQWTIFNALNSLLPSSFCNDMAIDRYDNVWVGVGTALAKWEAATEQWTIYSSLNSGLSSAPWRIAVDRSNMIWISEDSCVQRFDGVSWLTYDETTSPVLFEGADEIVVDNYGNIWFGSPTGLVKYDGITWEEYIDERYEQLTDGGVWTFDIDSKNNKWIGTYTGVGLLVFGPEMR